MRRLILATSGGDPVVQLFDYDSGAVTPVPSSLDGEGAFDNALGRDGWVAVQVGYEVAAFRDGRLLDPTRLPAAWRVCPGASADEVLIDCYKGGSRGPSEPARLVVVGADGAVRRAAELVVWQPIGEVGDIIVTEGGLLSWTGDPVTVPGLGTPLAVLGGNQIVLAGDASVEVVDLEGNSLGSCATPPNARFGLDVRYDARASRMAATALQHHGVLVAGVGLGPRWIGLDFVPWGPVWLDEQHLLLAGLNNGRALVMLELSSGSISEAPFPPRVPGLRLDVTGRFDVDQIHAVLPPKAWSPPSPEERAAVLAGQQEVLHHHAPRHLHPFVNLAVPAVRLRPCLAPRRPPIGGSRLGGRADLPPGTRWPEIDGTPLAFLAQLRLEEVTPTAPPEALPPTGLLVVFVGLEADGMFPVSERAVRAEIVDPSALQRARWPRRLPAELRFGQAVLVPEPVLSLPGWLPDVDDGEDESWAELVEGLTPPPPHHRVLGHPVSIQQNAAPVDATEPFVLLLQVDSDGSAGLAFGDGGSLHIWTPASSLRQGDLSRCVVLLDSY